MKRWKLTLTNNKELLLYAETQEDINIKAKTFSDLGDILSIIQCTDISYMDYINQIKQCGKLLLTQKRNRDIREFYECSYYKGIIIVMLSKDSTDNTYYDLAEYQEQGNKLIQPVLKTLSTPKELWKIISTPKPVYIICSHRYYGEPKLTKPKELKGINSIGTATFIQKKCNPQVFLKDNDLYIKHTDYFSSRWTSPKGERIDEPQDYYMNKYFGKSQKQKFTYPDNYADIVLRNEAWILLKDTLPLIRTENEIIFSQKILQKQKYDKYSYIGNDNQMEWERFWENVYKCVKNYLQMEK